MDEGGQDGYGRPSAGTATGNRSEGTTVPADQVGAVQDLVRSTLPNSRISGATRPMAFARAPLLRYGIRAQMVWPLRQGISGAGFAGKQGLG